MTKAELRSLFKCDSCDKDLSSWEQARIFVMLIKMRKIRPLIKGEKNEIVSN